MGNGEWGMGNGDKGDKGDNLFVLPIPDYPLPITNYPLPIPYF
nr:hypothetical protein [Hassalia byssoidea]